MINSIKIQSAYIVKTLPLIILVFGLLQGTVNAAHIEVTSNLDNGTSCTLREAVSSVNNAVLEPGCTINNGTLGDADRITFSNTLTDRTIALLNSEIRVTESVIIDASSVQGVTLKAADESVFEDKSLLIFDASGRDQPNIVVDSITISAKQSINPGTAIAVYEVNLELRNMLLTDNTSTGCGAAIRAAEFSILTINDSVISNNTASSGGAICSIPAASGLTINNSELSSNTALGPGAKGGAIFNVETLLFINNSTFSGNTASESGGAIYNQDAQVISVVGSTFSNNTAEIGDGGAIFMIHEFASPDSQKVENSTFSDNSAPSGTGGGLYMTGQRQSADYFIIRNSTLSGNSSGLHGSAIRSDDRRINMSNSTVANNNSGNNGGAFNVNSARVILRNSIIASSTGPACVKATTTFTSDSNSIIENGNCSSVARAINPGLEPLANNGGGTFTHSLSINSPAIDSGNSACEPKDQRGLDRDDMCDVGAFEAVGIRVVGVRIGNRSRDLVDGGRSSDSQPLLRIRFSGPAFDPPGDGVTSGDVTDETLYRLIAPGDDGINESNLSNGCLLGLQGDDTNLSINKASYVLTPQFILTRLDVNDGILLSPGNYTLLVCGSAGVNSVTDLHENTLDGNSDGTPGDDHVLNFTINDNSETCFPVSHQNNKASLVCF